MSEPEHCLQAAKAPRLFGGTGSEDRSDGIAASPSTRAHAALDVTMTPLRVRRGGCAELDDRARATATSAAGRAR